MGRGAVARALQTQIDRPDTAELDGIAKQPGRLLHPSGVDRQEGGSRLGQGNHVAKVHQSEIVDVRTARFGIAVARAETDNQAVLPSSGREAISKLRLTAGRVDVLQWIGNEDMVGQA